MIRVAISGAHGTGKTTLTHALAEHLNQQGVVCSTRPEVVREISDQLKGLPAIPRFLKILSHHFQRLDNTEESACCLYDRGFVDVLTYLRTEGPQNTPHLERLLESITYSAIPMFDTYIYLPIEFPVEDDGVRPMSETYRSRVDNELKRAAAGLNVLWVEIGGPLPERIERATQLIRSLIEQKNSH